jgi:hypothetical protein
MTRLPGCSRSHAAKLTARRSGSRSTGRLVVMSTSTVPCTCPRRSAKSSTPSTAIEPIGGSGSARIKRNRVLRLAGRPNTPASRDPARPANARPIASSMPRSNGVRRECRAVSPPTCSANVRAVQSLLSQKNRLTHSRISVGQPARAASSRQRSYRLCTRVDLTPQCGHRAGIGDAAG